MLLYKGRDLGNHLISMIIMMSDYDDNLGMKMMMMMMKIMKMIMMMMMNITVFYDNDDSDQEGLL